MTKYRVKKHGANWTGCKEGRPYAFFLSKEKAQAWVADQRRKGNETQTTNPVGKRGEA